MVVVAGRILVGQLRLRHNIRLRSRRVLGGARPSTRSAAMLVTGPADGRRSRADSRPNRFERPARLLRLRSRNVAVGGGASPRVTPPRQRRSSNNSMNRAMRRTATRLRIPSRS